jgi:hypothetical protein
LAQIGSHNGLLQNYIKMYGKNRCRQNRFMEEDYIDNERLEARSGLYQHKKFNDEAIEAFALQPWYTLDRCIR